MITFADFATALTSASALLPYGRSLPRSAYALAWDTMPEEAKRDLTPEILNYAIGQFLLDPDRPKDCPTHLALLRYVYRLENDWPNFRWGLKQDLSDRMRNPAVLHGHGSTSLRRLSAA
jgi:hypothetical protein